MEQPLPFLPSELWLHILELIPGSNKLLLPIILQMPEYQDSFVHTLHSKLRDFTPYELLRMYSESGYIGIVKYLSSIHNFADYEFSEALRRASGNGHTCLVKYFIDEKHGNRRIAANNAAEGGHFKLVKWLINERQYDNFNDVLLHAAKSGHFKMVKWLIEEKGANDPNGALKSAAENNEFELVTWLVNEKGADDPGIILYHAARYGNFEMVKWSVNLGANEFNLALEVACGFQNMEIAKYLIIEKGADNLLDAYVHASEHGPTELSEWLIERGALANM